MKAGLVGRWVRAALACAAVVFGLGASAGVLPLGYTRLDYLETDGGQQVDTGIHAGPKTTVDFSFATTKIVGDTAFFGSHTWTGGTYLFIEQSGNFRFYGDGKNIFACTADTDYRFVIDANNKGTLSSGGTVLAKVDVNRANGDKCNLFLFALENDSRFHVNCRFYSMTIAEDGETVRDLVPCLDDKGAVCIYDFVTGTSLVNSGARPFVVPAPPYPEDSGAIEVRNDFGELAELSPSAGIHAVADGSTTVCTAKTVTNLTTWVRYVPTGYLLETFDRATKTWTLEQHEGASYTHVQSGTEVKRITWVYGAEYRVRASGVDGATVSFDGATFAPVVEEWMPVGTPSEVSVTAQVPSGMLFVGFAGVPPDAVVVDRTVTFTSASAVDVTATAHIPAVRRWRGGTGSLASEVANWVDDGGQPAGAVPNTGDTIILDGGAASLTWDLDIVPASWTQTADYTGTVTFMTGISRVANGTEQTAHGALDEDRVTRVLKVTGDVTVNGGKWTHAANPTMKNTEEAWTDGKGIYRLLVKAGGQFTLGADAMIDVSGVGYASVNGPGSSTGEYSASHGGLGIRVSYAYEAWDKARPSGDKPCYGSVKRSCTLGSGGNNKVGGGAVVIEAAGAATVAGKILANGQGGAGARNAAGGAVQVKAGSIALTGEISCDGGDSTNYGCGAGGRIALITTDDGATLDDVDRSLLHCYPGAQKSWAAAGNGTIYFETAADEGRGELYLNCNGRNVDPCFGAGIHTDTSDSDFRRVTFANRGMVSLLPGGVLRTDELVGVASDTTAKGVWMGGGVLTCDRDVLTCDGMRIVSSARRPSEWGMVPSGGVVRVKSGAGTLRFADANSILQVDSPLEIDASVELAAGSKVTCCDWGTMHKVHAAAGYGTYGLKTETYCETNKMTLTVNGDMSVAAGAQVTAVGTGFTYGTGPGHSTVSGRRGASHGGRAIGYETTQSTDVQDVSPCYDDICAPHMPGSGGSGTTSDGGGIIDLTVTGKLSIDGTITAAGKDASSAGPGAGGSIQVKAGEIDSPGGTGRISADAGTLTSSGYYCASGGGRVAVTLTKEGADFSDFGLLPGQITAYGSLVNFKIDNKWTAKRYGGPGTVYLRTAAQAIDEGTLLVANGDSLISPSWADITADVEGRAFGDVILREDAILHLDGDVELAVKGSWLTSGGASLSNAPGATVSFIGPATATISGTNEFCRVICEVPGKTLKFGGADDSLLSVRSDGALTFRGEEGNLLNLHPAVEGTHWPIKVEEGAALKVECADVALSDASAGVKITAGNSTGKDADNINWGFSDVRPGQTIVWNGRGGGSWLAAGSWDRERSPISTDLIVIPADCDTYPTIVEDFTASNVTVQAGASLTVNAVLTIADALTVQGELSGSGTLILPAGVTADLAAADLSGFTGSVVADIADKTRTLSLGAAKMASFAVTLDGGRLSLPTGASAEHLTVSGTGAVIFGAGSSSEAGYLTVAGSSANALALAGADDGTWMLKVTRQARVDGVTCGGSDASKGIAICATSSMAAGAANVNWSFAGKQCVWTGGAGTSDWDTADNWGAKKVPDAGDVVIVDDPEANIVASTPIAAFDLYITGGSLRLAEGGEIANGVDSGEGSVLTVDKPLAVANSVYLRTGSTLTHSANADTALYKLDLTVGGELVLERGAVIDVMGKGYARIKGPGAPTSTGAQVGGGYGGRASNADHKATTSTPQVKDCYGSVRNPTDLGSGGASSAGGGAVLLKVGGTFTLDGEIICRGVRVSQYSGSGGSVNITCRELLGSGTIDANAGYYTGGGWAGGGGRVALALTGEGATFDDLKIKVTAYGCISRTDAGTMGTKAYSSCGTIFRRVKDDPEDGGEIIIDGFGATKYDAPASDWYALDLCTQVPARGEGADSPKAFANTRFVVRKGGTLFLPCDLKVGDLDVQDGGRIRLDGHTLTVISWKHRNRKGWENQTPELNSVMLAETDATDGRIVWQPHGLMLFVK